MDALEDYSKFAGDPSEFMKGSKKYCVVSSLKKSCTSDASEDKLALRMFA